MDRLGRPDSMFRLTSLLQRKPVRGVKEETVDSQIIYKLATIETQVKGINDNLVTAIKRLEEKIEDHSKHNQEALALVKGRADLTDKRIDGNEKRLTALEGWRTQLFTKMGFVVSGVSVFWLVFGKAIETSITSIF